MLVQSAIDVGSVGCRKVATLNPVSAIAACGVSLRRLDGIFDPDANDKEK